jgi:cytochrome c-type biogenesis protein CcmH/NrfG
MMARLYFDAKLLNPAIGLLEKVARTDPDDPEALVMLAEAALAGGRVTEAALLFEKVAPAVEGFRANTKRQEDLRRRLLTGAMQVAEVNNNWPLVQKLSEQLLRIEPNNAAALEKLGRALFRQNKGEEAYRQLQKAAAADPKLPPAELAMATLFTDKETPKSGSAMRSSAAATTFAPNWPWGSSACAAIALTMPRSTPTKRLSSIRTAWSPTCSRALSRVCKKIIRPRSNT